MKFLKIKRTYRNLGMLMMAICFINLFVGIAACDACPTCKDSLSENDAHLVAGYFWSIVFMMSMPFTILGGLSLYFYFQIRKARFQNMTDQSMADQKSATAKPSLVPTS